MVQAPPAKQASVLFCRCGWAPSASPSWTYWPTWPSRAAERLPLHAIADEDGRSLSNLIAFMVETQLEEYKRGKQ